MVIIANGQWECTDGSGDWSLEGAILTISGTGSIAFTSPDVAPWYEHLDLINMVNIELGITKIAQNSFDSYTQLKWVGLPSTIEECPAIAFANCPILEYKIVNPTGPYYTKNGVLFLETDGVTYLAAYPLAKCDSSYAIPLGTYGIKEYAFTGTVFLKNVFIPGTLIRIEPYGFFKTQSIESITFEGLAVPSENAFMMGTKDSPAQCTIYSDGWASDITLNFTSASYTTCTYKVPEGIYFKSKDSWIKADTTTDIQLMCKQQQLVHGNILMMKGEFFDDECWFVYGSPVGNLFQFDIYDAENNFHISMPLRYIGLNPNETLHIVCYNSESSVNGIGLMLDISALTSATLYILFISTLTDDIIHVSDNYTVVASEIRLT